MLASFRSIAKAAKHEVTVEDLQQDAWVIAQEIGERRGREIDFGDFSDQDLVIRAVNVRNVKRGDWNMRKSVRIDRDREDDEGAVKWSEILPAREASDPLIALLLKESAFDKEVLLASSYSQATAYIMVLFHFKSNRQDICAYLVISNDTLSRRVTFAAESVKVQPSLFDRVETIDKDFMPQRGRQFESKAEQGFASTQGAWEF